MQVYHGILTQLRADLPILSKIVAGHQDKSRAALSRIICAKFGFQDRCGRPRLSGCMKALRSLDTEGRISLPKPQSSSPVRGPRLLDTPIPKATGVPSDVGQIQDLSIELVQSKADLAVWNTLVAAEHPRGTTTFAGAQLRYLIQSAHGALGAAIFSASALYLKPRDDWMAWSSVQRTQNAHRVVNLSRFLIRPDVKCKNLASCALSRIFRRLRSDFHARYGYIPYLVETFVGPEQEGICFRAVGFRYLGLSKGRGRHAPSKVCLLSPKKVFAYELVPNWRKRMGLESVELHPRLDLGAGLDRNNWAEQEFGKAELGDQRRTARLVKIATLLANTMGKSVTATPTYDRQSARAYWRFLDRADELGIGPKQILAPHRQRTIERARKEDTVLCVQDGTKISFSTCTNSEGLDVIGRNQTSAKSYGVHLHATIALNEDGLPLGVLRCAYGTQSPKTRTWIEGLRDMDEAAETLPRKTEVICVMAREADMFEMFAVQQTLKWTQVLVRARHDRKLGRNERLFRALRKGPSAAVMEMRVEEMSRRMKSGRVTYEGRPRRNARMEIRYHKVLLRPTKDLTQAPIPVWGLHLYELHPPADAKRIEWYLLTTKEVSTPEQAEQIVTYYKLRWRVKDTFRVLKSGCKIERLRLQKASSLHRAITIYMVTSWRIMLLTLLGRTTIHLDIEAVFQESEIDMMKIYARLYNLPTPSDLPTAILLVALMGGYQNRKYDPPPGYEVMWNGHASLQMRAVAYEEVEEYKTLKTNSPE